MKKINMKIIFAYFLMWLQATLMGTIVFSFVAALWGGSIFHVILTGAGLTLVFEAAFTALYLLRDGIDLVDDWQAEQQMKIEKLKHENSLRHLRDKTGVD